VSDINVNIPAALRKLFNATGTHTRVGNVIADALDLDTDVNATGEYPALLRDILQLLVTAARVRPQPTSEGKAS
jgi:hypothetical protein